MAAEPQKPETFADSTEKALAFLSDDAQIPAAPVQPPQQANREEIYAHVKQILPSEESEEERELIFLAYDLGRIALGAKNTDSDGKKTYHWNVHSTNGNSKGTFFNAENETGVVKATHAKRLPHSQVVLVDEHAPKEFLEEGFVEDVFPTFADALGFLRKHPQASFSNAYKYTFRKLDRAAINLFNQLRSAFKFTIHEEPIDLETKIHQHSALPNIRQLIGDQTAAYWQTSTALSLRIKNSDYREQGENAERRAPDSQRFNRARLGLKEHLAIISESPIAYADEAKVPALGDVLRATIDRLMPVYTATHPSSTILRPVIYSGDAAASETGQNLRQLNKTTRALIQYFGHEKLENGKTLREEYAPWRKFEEAVAQFGKTPLFFHFPSWQPLYEQGHHITVQVPDMMAAIKAIEGSAQAGHIVMPPRGMGAGVYAEFKDKNDNVVGLWQPKL